MSEAAATTRDSPPPWMIALGFAIIYLTWGTTYFATSVGVAQEKMPPIIFSGTRLCLGGVFLLSIQFYRGQRLRISGKEFASLFAVSVCFFLLANLFVTVGQKWVQSGLAATLIATTPLWMAFFGLFWPGSDPLSWRGWLGLLIGIPGVLLTQWNDLNSGFTLLTNYPVLMVLGSAVSWAIGSLIARHMTLRIPHLSSAAYQMLFGGVCQLTIGTSLGEWSELPHPIPLRAVAAFLHLLIFGSLLGFVAYNWLLGHVSVTKVGTYAYINPVLAVVLGCCAGETDLSMELVAGIAVILFGVYLVRGDRAPSREIEIEPD